MSAQPSKELVKEIFFFLYIYIDETEGVDDVLDHLGCFCREIVDNHEKENALNIVTEERTYHIYAESPEDARYTIPTFSTLFIFALSACLCEKKNKINEWGQSSPLWTAVVFYLINST